MSFSLIPTAFAAASPSPGPFGEGFSSLLMLAGFVLIFYFLLWRPQSKRAKEHRELLANLAIGDEVITNGGVVGRIARMADNFIVLEIADGVQMVVQKPAVVNVVPKGTMKSV